VRCDLTFERAGSTSISFTSDDEPTWFDLQFPAVVNGREMNVVRVNLGNVPDPPAGGRWECRVTILDELSSFDCGVFNVEFPQQLGDAAPGQGGGGGEEETRFALSDHSILCEMTDEIVGPGAIDAPAGAVILFFNTIGVPRGTLRMYIGHGTSTGNGVSTQLEVDGGNELGNETSLTVPAVGASGQGAGWSQFDIDGVMAEIAGEWASGDPSVPPPGDFEIAVELVSGHIPSVSSNTGIIGTWFDPDTANYGFRVVSSSGVWVFRVQFRDPVTLAVFAVGLFTIDLDTIFL
jgi:hypothetical protein